ncbi:hypothetical protein HELRODRAFT_194914 [Helobdella robusta]|uniref:Uncharacterized protein n=1 Tax=Helobdella robusta TaxID=6412 RepID=T1FWK3_HELRO|nr:hypothetical protein HELRODRAFT_194914 [Helobdella robusta]ESO10516.1 hypothetical protein HELRODRAFT_194914 [Helobdella robusta]
MRLIFVSFVFLFNAIITLAQGRDDRHDIKLTFDCSEVKLNEHHYQLCDLKVEKPRNITYNSTTLNAVINSCLDAEFRSQTCFRDTVDQMMRTDYYLEAGVGYVRTTGIKYKDYQGSLEHLTCYRTTLSLPTTSISLLNDKYCTFKSMTNLRQQCSSEKSKAVIAVNDYSQRSVDGAQSRAGWRKTESFSTSAESRSCSHLAEFPIVRGPSTPIAISFVPQTLSRLGMLFYHASSGMVFEFSGEEDVCKRASTVGLGKGNRLPFKDVVRGHSTSDCNLLRISDHGHLGYSFFTLATNQVEL